MDHAFLTCDRPGEKIYERLYQSLSEFFKENESPPTVCLKILTVALMTFASLIFRCRLEVEDEVAQLLALKDPKEKKLGFASLLSSGNFSHITEVLQTGNGNLIFSRRSKKKVDTEKYLPCVHCLALYLDRDLYRHQRRCSQKKENDGAETSRPIKNLIAVSRLSLEGAVQGQNSFYIERI